MRLIDVDALIDEINKRIDNAIKWGVNAIADRDEEIKLRAEQAVATFCEASLTAKKMPTIEPEWAKIDSGAIELELPVDVSQVKRIIVKQKDSHWCGVYYLGGHEE